MLGLFSHLLSKQRFRILYKDMVLRESFVEFIAKHYLSKFSEFSDPVAAANEINAWVSEITQNKITHIVDAKALAVVKMILLNAIYFKGKWKQEFRKRDTEGKLFYSTPARLINVRIKAQIAL